MPGGQSESSFLSVFAEVLEERSTGCWLPTLGPSLFLVAVAGGEILGEGAGGEAVRALEGRNGLGRAVAVFADSGVGGGGVVEATLAGLVVGI